MQITITNASGVVYTDTQNVENGLNANDSTTVPFTWTPDNTGNYTIIAEVDPDNTVNESNESDNYYTKTITVLPKPNLVIKDITTTTPIYNNTLTEINITIANNGAADVNTTFPVKIIITNASGNAVYTNTTDVSGLNASDSTTLTFNWTPTNTGEYTITAFVDSNNTVDELNENDNYYTKTITVLLAKPNLVIKNITTTTPIYNSYQHWRIHHHSSCRFKQYRN